MRSERERAIVDLFTAIESPSGPAYECSYYPCHFENQDCSLCFCPFYPCLIYKLGGEITVSSTGNYVWSCKNCSWIHRKDVVDEIAEYFSSFPRQFLVEVNWHFFNKSLQEILFGVELGRFEGGVYNLMPANFYGCECEIMNSGEFLDVTIKEFRIISVRRVRKIEDAAGIAIPEKSGDVIVGMGEKGFVRCTL